MKDLTESKTNPLPGYFLAIIDKSQMSNVKFQGDDKFDLPQSGVMIKLHKDDEGKVYDAKGSTYKTLVGKRVRWAKYAEADCLFYDDVLKKDVVLIAIDKLRGYE